MGNVRHEGVLSLERLAEMSAFRQGVGSR